MKKINVLLVDDMVLVLESTAAFLKREFNVYTAGNGKEAWDILQSQEIDCLVTDANMPTMNGFELLTKIDEKNYDIKTILVNGAYDMSAKGESVGLKVDAYIQKPYWPNDLIETIKNLFGS